jgi:hypothetical protein
VKQFLRCLIFALSVLSAAPGAAIDFTPAPCGGAPFDDVPANHPFCPWIDRLDADQITGGCGGGDYCPDGPVTRAQLAMLLEKAMRGTAGWDPWRGAYRRTLIVNPILTGNPPQLDPLASGQRLVTLLAAISGNAIDNPYLLHLEPGIFDLGPGALTLKPFVDVEGSGEGVTVIRGASSGAVIEGADDVEVRSLTVEHVPGGASSVAFDLAGDATRLTRVTALATGGASANHAITAAGTGAVFTEVTAVAAAPVGGSAIAIYITGDAVLRRVTAKAQGGASSSAIVATAGSSLAEDVTATASSATFLRGVSLETGASATLRRVDAFASTGLAGATAIGLSLLDGNVTVDGGSYVATAQTSYGLLCSQLAGSHTARIRNSRIAGVAHSVKADAGYEVFVGDSLMGGGAVDPNGGSITCFGAYDSDYTNGQLDACP